MTNNQGMVDENDEDYALLEEHYTKKRTNEYKSSRNTEKAVNTTNQKQKLDDGQSKDKVLVKDITDEMVDEPIIEDKPHIDKTDVSHEVLTVNDGSCEKVKEINQELFMVSSVLKEIPDSLTCGKVKPKDKALNAMLDKVRDYLSTRSHLDDLTDETTMGEVKALLNGMSKDDRVRILNVYTDIRYGDLDNPGTLKRVMDIMQEHPKVVVLIGGFILLAIFITIDGITGKGNDTIFSSLLNIINGLTGMGSGNNNDLKI